MSRRVWRVQLINARNSEIECVHGGALRWPKRNAGRGDFFDTVTTMFIRASAGRFFEFGTSDPPTKDALKR